MGLTAINSYSVTGLVPVYPFRARRINVNLAPGVTLTRGTVLGELTPANDVQTVTVTGTPTGGTFTLTAAGQTTAAVAYNATAAQVAAAVAALGVVGAGNVAGTGGPLPGAAVVLTFQGALGNQPVALMTAAAALTGGTTPAAAVAHTTTGQAPGTYKAYAAGNADGSQVARGVLEYDAAADSSGNITLGGSASGGQWQQTQKAVPLFIAGDFFTGELVGLDANAVTNLSAHLVQGTTTSGVISV